MRRPGIDPGSVAVAVPCYREASQAASLAASIGALDPAPGAILVVDDGSPDRTAAELRDHDFLEVLQHGENLGLGAARNTLWRRADELGMHAVAFLDADVRVPPDYLRKVCAQLVGDGVAGVGGRNVDADPATWVDAWRGRFWPQDLGEGARMDAPMLVGACATYRLSALRTVGGFNPLFRTNGEDVEIGRRLRASGLRLVYDPQIVVHHVRRDTPGRLVTTCYRHCRDGMRATVGTPGEEPGPGRLVFGMARKAVRAPAAALVRRRDPREAALGAAACSAGLVGYLVGWARPRPG